jgi:hypothetical protein
MDMCPQHISKSAYYSIIFITQCIYVSIYYNYYLLTILLSGLTVTSVCFWSDCSDVSIRTIDIAFAVTTLGVKSYIALTDFTPFYRTVWFISLSISIIANYLNHKFIEYKDKLMIEDEKVHYISTYTHMFFIHFLPTTTFSLCVILSFGFFN